MTWSTSRRRATLPPDWQATRRRILDRDHSQCVWERASTGRVCGRPATQVDHIVRPADGGSDEDTNLQALCRWHHQAKSSSEGGQASAAARPSRSRPVEAHPGLRSKT
ncbi:HNH endonuclease [Kitasatospora indigofera]|uniref:HNH endonuclease n=1 Tax=Kitasatospora indigofera TaxID=67307 RepID=UPI00368E8BEF